MSSYSESAEQSTMTQESQETKPTASSVPDLVRIGQIPTNTAIDIETDILDPVVHNDTFCRFQLQNKGILHSHSKIILRLSANAVKSFAPIGVGLHSLIQRSRLAVGTKTISEIDDFNHYIGYKSAFLSNEHQKEREQYVSGRQIAWRPYYDDGANSALASASGSFYGASPSSASAIGLDNGQCLLSSPLDGQVLRGDVELKNHAVNNGTYGIEYAISIQDLFPFLYQNQLPLYMIKEPVVIELTFSTAIGQRCCIAQGEATNTPFTIDTTATQLVADYQYFPQEMMEEYALQNRDMTFTYMDYRLSKRSITQSASGAEVSSGELIVNVGGAGRIVTKVIQMVSNDQEVGEAFLLNDYHARALKRTYTGGTPANGVLTSNIKYNDNFLYPVDVKNPAYQFHNVVTAEGMVPFVTRDAYSNYGAQTTTTKLEGNTQGTGTADTETHDGALEDDNASGVVSQFFYQAYKLNRNERVNQRGVELYNTWNAFKNPTDSATTLTQRAYVELVKVATLKDGVMEVFFA